MKTNGNHAHQNKSTRPDIPKKSFAKANLLRLHATPWPYSRLVPLGCAQGPSWASLSRRYGSLAVGSMPIEPTADGRAGRRQSDLSLSPLPSLLLSLSSLLFLSPLSPCHGASATRPSTLLTLTTNRNRFCPPFPTFCHVFLVAGHVRALFGAAPLPRNASPYHPLLLPTSLSLSHAPPSNSNICCLLRATTSS